MTPEERSILNVITVLVFVSWANLLAYVWVVL